MKPKPLILASQSPSRRRMLRAAGVPHQAVAARIDEDSVKGRLVAEGYGGGDLALALALAKAMSVSVLRPDDLVLGCDQTLQCSDGTMLDKAPDAAALAQQLQGLSGKTHVLHSAAVAVRNSQIVWKALEPARMTMRTLSPAFIADYLEREGDAVLGCVGGYRIEGLGAQLFDAVEGSLFVVQGLPLLALLGFLRTEGLIAA